MKYFCFFTLSLISFMAISQDNPDTNKEAPSSLGAFSMSLNVKDLTASKEFYEKLGFTHFHGSMEDNYLIMKNGSTVIGLFQGMFEGNIMTFNPGWDQSAQTIDGFTDIRKIEKDLIEKGITPISGTDGSTSGPANIMIADPDGNLILLDQHAE